MSTNVVNGVEFIANENVQTRLKSTNNLHF